MIALLGASGYIGQAFGRELQCRSLPFIAVSRREVDYTRFDELVRFLRERKPDFLINAAGYTGKPNVDACENARAETLAGNALLPQMIAHACAVADVPWGHVSSGCIYSGAKVQRNGGSRIETDMNRPDLRALAESSPESIGGFTESDEPNFSFRHPPCSFYSGAKQLAEEAIRGVGRSYIWRLRIPFDEHDSPRNFLSKIQRYAKVYDNLNSISHRGDFVRACLDLWQNGAPFGTYNVTNPGFISSRQVVAWAQQILRLDRPFEFWASDEEFYRAAAKVPRSNCVMDASKLLAAGVRLRPVGEAIKASLRDWKPEKAGTS